MVGRFCVNFFQNDSGSVEMIGGVAFVSFFGCNLSVVYFSFFVVICLNHSVSIELLMWNASHVQKQPSKTDRHIWKIRSEKP